MSKVPTIAPPLIRNLRKIYQKVHLYDKDVVLCIDGKPGHGKSTLAAQIGYALDPTFNEDHLCIETEEFGDKIMHSDHYQCWVFDESYRGLPSSGSHNKELLSKLLECRQANLFIILCIPSVFLLQKYMRNSRIDGLIHVYERKGQHYWKAWFGSRYKQLLYWGHKFESYKKPYTHLVGRFPKDIPAPIDWKAYLDKKWASYVEEIALRDGNNKFKAQRDILLLEWIKKSNLNDTQASKELVNLNISLSQPTIGQIRSKLTPRVVN